jgi:hypothetical protein
LFFGSQFNQQIDIGDVSMGENFNSLFYLSRGQKVPIVLRAKYKAMQKSEIYRDVALQESFAPASVVAPFNGISDAEFARLDWAALTTSSPSLTADTAAIFRWINMIYKTLQSDHLDFGQATAEL